MGELDKLKNVTVLKDPLDEVFKPAEEKGITLKQMDDEASKLMEHIKGGGAINMTPEVRKALEGMLKADEATRARNDKILKQFQSFPEIRNIDCPKCSMAMCYDKMHAHSGFADMMDDAVVISFTCKHCNIAVVIIQRARWEM